MGISSNSVVVVGLQWGDEGKGKIVDLLSLEADIVARFQGGNNAGHTLVVDGNQTVLHLIPSGALHERSVCVIGGGVVVDPTALVSELSELRMSGFLTDPARLRVSQECQLILPYHKAIDQAREKRRGKGRIGTTGRGIGPAYEDKAARIGLRMSDLRDLDHFKQRLAEIVEDKNSYLRGILDADALAYDTMVDGLLDAGRFLAPHIADTSRYLCDSISAGKKVLFEGAQGVMLDVDHGTYPFVTSSNTSAGAVSNGAGVPPKAIGHVVGITKAYTTRVGGGPFPTELEDAIGNRLREEGGEFGATTGRPRRCGWFDAALVRKSARLSGADSLALTKLDVLTGIDPLRICVGYELGGERLDEPPSLAADVEAATPVYEDVPGWHEPVTAVRRVEDFPETCRAYVKRLSSLVGVPVNIYSVGPGRDETLVIDSVFSA